MTPNPFKHRRGSILIWSLMLGLVLFTAFFFFATRLALNLAAEGATTERMNDMTFVKSYVEYLKKHPSEVNGDMDFGGVKFKVKLTQQVAALEGVLDAGAESPTYDLEKKSVTITWMPCDANAADLYVNEVFTVASPACSASVTEAETLTLRSANAPAVYKIVPTPTEPPANPPVLLTDTLWHLNLSYLPRVGKKIIVQKTFPVTAP